MDSAGDNASTLRNGKPATPMLLFVAALIVVMALAGLVAAVAASSEHDSAAPRAIRVSDRMSKLRDRIEP
ncbi:MAG: hypothetical protein ACR2JU_06030 [Nocardioidaceae bacterium]